MCRNGEVANTTKEWKYICDSIIRSGVEECILAGGEPTLHPNFFEIVQAFVSSGVKVNVLTNGTLIDEKKAKFLLDNGCLVQVSIDGGSEETHNLTRGRDSFLKMSQGLSFLREKGVSFATKFTITDSNFLETGDFVRLSKKLGALSANLRRCVPVGNGKEIKKMSADTLKVAYEDAFRAGRDCKIKVSTSDFFALLSFLPARKEIIEAKLKSAPNTIIGGCPIGWTAYYVRWDGVVTFCPYLSVECGNLFKQDFIEIWEKSEMYRISRNFRWNLVGTCSKCDYLMACGGCPAVTYHVNGNILGSDPQCWI